MIKKYKTSARDTNRIALAGSINNNIVGEALQLYNRTVHEYPDLVAIIDIMGELR